jgi:hypothetical protein
MNNQSMSKKPPDIYKTTKLSLSQVIKKDVNATPLLDVDPANPIPV